MVIANQEKKKNLGREEAKYIDLPDAVKGQVVVRFPPEASGYLHIGHAKAALLNYYYQNAFEGKLIFRFDDTNPAKENEEFENVIRVDVDLLQIKPDICSYTSDHFDFILQQCEMLLQNNLAYVDDTPNEEMKNERELKVESKNRNNSVDKNLKMWQEMKGGTEFGQKCCVRVKMDMSSPNGCLRDPTIYRCKKEKHPRTGNKYNVYPTYDFACPIVDSVEGVTHALRTTEYADRDAQFYWILDLLKLRKPHIYSYSRLNMMNTVLSKRKLTWFVENGLVDGWDDPRMPTVRGILRRGMTVEALKHFIVAQGSSRSVVYMDWDKIWSFNRKVIDVISPRFMCIEAENCCIMNVDSKSEYINVAAHPHLANFTSLPKKVGPKLYIDQTDAQMIKEGNKVTLMKWGNVNVTKVERNSSGIVTSIDAKLNLQDTDFKKVLKICWLSVDGTIKAKFKYFEHLISKQVLAKNEDFKEYVNIPSLMELEFFVDEAVASLEKKSILQFLRRGYFIIDETYDCEPMIHTGLVKPGVFISIPDGTTDLNIFPSRVQEWKKSLRQSASKTNSCKTESTSEKQKNIYQVQESNSKVICSANNEIKNESKVGGDKLSVSIEKIEELDKGIRVVGDNIRKLKAAKEDKKIIDENVSLLLMLKAQYKEASGKDWVPPSLSSSQPKNNNVVKNQPSSRPQENKAQPTAKMTTPDGSEPLPVSQKNVEKQVKSKEVKKEVKKKETVKAEKKEKTGLTNKKQTRLGIEVKKGENLADWYTEVITKAEMIEYYDISGCYILRPWAYGIWEKIQTFFDQKIRKLGVQNCYFPMFVSASALEKEKTHIADFAPEVAWVTKSGSTDLADPIAIRPTSETVMYPSYAKWVKSHRDLPIKLNQWCNVVRWEFKNPTPFLRTREFLWQEGHTAHEDKESAVKEVHEILDYYAQIYEDLLAVPVIKGKKTEKEKFAGADFTTTIEGYVEANGRGIQAATSHHLGQNFSKMFEIVYEDPKEPAKFNYVYQNSWGLSTRTIGCMIIVHGDDKGLVLPPNSSSHCTLWHHC